MGLFKFQCASTFILGGMRWLLVLGGNENSFLWDPVNKGFLITAASWLITIGYFYRSAHDLDHERMLNDERMEFEEQSRRQAHERWGLESKIRVMKEERETFLNLTEKLRATLEMKMQEPKVITVAQEVFKQEQDAISSFI